MIRFNFLIENTWLERLRDEMKSYGFSSVGAFIRFIIIKFFDKNNSSNK